MAAPTSSPALKRTPLHDRHVEAGARLVPFAGWEMPVQYEGVGAEHLAVRERVRRLRRLAHGRDRDVRPAGAGLPAADPLQRRVASSPSAARSTACCAARTAASSTTSSPTAWRADRYLTVTNAVQPREGPRLVPAARRRLRRARSPTPHERYAMLAVQGPRAREIVQAISDAALPERFTTAHAHPARPARSSSAAPATPARTASSCCCDPGDAVALWDEVVRRGATPAGLGARDTLRLEVCYHLYGNDLMEDARPDRGRPRLGLQGGHRLHRLRRGPRRVRDGRPGREARRLPPDRPGHRPPGQPGRRRRRGHQRHHVAQPRRRHRHGLRARRPGRAGHRTARSTSAASSAPPWSRKKPLYAKETNG